MFACVCVCSDVYVPAVLEILLHVALGWEPWVRVQKDNGVHMVIWSSEQASICSARQKVLADMILPLEKQNDEILLYKGHFMNLLAG